MAQALVLVPVDLLGLALALSVGVWAQVQALLEELRLAVATLDAPVVLAPVTSFQVDLDCSVEVAALVHVRARGVPSDLRQAFSLEVETVDLDHSEQVATPAPFQAWREVSILLLAFSQELETV